MTSGVAGGGFQVRLVRAGACPQCGAPIEFASGSAPAQVCKHCRFVIVRTDRDLRAIGRVADLVPMASPFGTDARGTIEGRPFRVAGRVQYDRVHAPGAPWEEIYLELDNGGWSWLAHAQGRWLLTALYAHPLPVRPPTFAEANPGIVFPVPNMPGLAVAERGQRRFLSAEGELPFPMVPNQVEAFADLAGPNGTFATIDYDAQGIPAHLYFGRQIDPRQIALTSGAPLAQFGEGTPKAQVTALFCPKCGGNLPLAAPDKTERIACRYCGMLCDVNQGALIALRPLPLPAHPPAIPLGSKGHLRGREVQILGYMIRSTEVEGEIYAWREYLLYATEANAPGSFVFLLEEDGQWQFIVPIHPGEAQTIAHGRLQFRGEQYVYQQSVLATVDSVIGEFYWRVEIGEQVQAIEYNGPRNQKLSQESTADEVQFSHSTPLAIDELKKAFPGAFTPSKSLVHEQRRRNNLIFLPLFVLWAIVSAIGCALAPGKVVLEKDVPVFVDAPRLPGALRPIGAAAQVPAEPTFSDPFSISGGKNLKMDLRAGSGCLDADDAWVSADVALVHTETGEVWEDAVTFSDYERSLWYSRLPAGQYVLRVDPDGNPGTCTNPIHFALISGSVPYGYIMLSFGLLVLLWLWGTKLSSGHD